MRTVRLTLLLVFLLMMATTVLAQREAVDGIVAVVGDEVILGSELSTQVQLIILQTQKKPKNQTELDEMQAELLDNLINEKLFLIEARKDTSITVRPEEIDQGLDDHVARIAQNFPSEDDFLAALSAEGLTLRDLRKQYRGDVENRLVKQRLIQQKLSSVSVSRHEVEQFFQDYRDSIPNQPEGVKLAHILLEFAPSKVVEDSIKAVAEGLRQQVIEGANLADLSTEHSSGGFGANGGDLGWISRDDVIADFARAAFALQPGDLSGVVRTQFGYHVIRCEGRDEDRIRLRHILLEVKPSMDDSAGTHRVADSLLGELRAGGDFAELAKTFSSDDDTRPQGGELGWFATEEMPPEFVDAVRGWEEPGEYRGPVKSRFGLHILNLLDYQGEKEFTLEDDYDRIKELARQYKTDATINQWVEKVRDRTYVDIRLDN